MRVEYRAPTNRFPYADKERVQLRSNNPVPGARPLNQSLLGVRVHVDVHARDTYGRVVGDVRVIGTSQAAGW